MITKPLGTTFIITSFILDSFYNGIQFGIRVNGIQMRLYLSILNTLCVIVK